MDGYFRSDASVRGSVAAWSAIEPYGCMKNNKNNKNKKNINKKRKIEETCGWEALGALAHQP